MTALFREEAYRSFETSPWQPPLLSAPVSGLLLLLFVMSTAGTIVGFAISFEFVRREQAHGFLTPTEGWTRVAAVSHGVVQRRIVKPGDHVKAGDVLMRLSPAEGLKKGLTVQAKLLAEVQAQRSLLESQERLLLEKHENDLQRLEQERKLAEKELASLEKELTLHRGRLASAQQRLNDGERLAAQGALAEADVRGLLDAVRALAADVSEKERATAHTRALLNGAEERRSRLLLDLASSQIALHDRLHDLAMQEHRARGEAAPRVLAPRSGVVASVRVRTGDRVMPGGWLLDILPHNAVLHARLFAPPAAMGKVAIGQPVRVYLDAFPYERHGAQLGRVVSISESTLMDPGNSSTPDGPSFQVDVSFPKGFTLEPEDLTALRPGMTVTADLIGARGTLLDWALDPLKKAADRT